MTTAYGQDLQIEDLRNHPAEMVLALRRLLTGGAKVTADPKRPGFYEIESGGVVYYVHESLSSGKILLLATWPAEAAMAEELSAA
ncbi:MAG: hypothetical protein WAJ92_07660 [Candidatus Acidiferrales bacterium]